MSLIKINRATFLQIIPNLALICANYTKSTINMCSTSPKAYYFEVRVG